MNFKDVLYKNYRSTHNEILQGGSQSLKKIEQSFEILDNYFFKLLPKDKKSNILDLGCGDGNFVHYLRSKGYLKVTGIDISEEQINLGNQLGITDLKLVSLNDHLLSKKDEFDFIIARDVIEHLTKQEAFEALSMVYQSLKPKSRFVMTVPNGQGLFFSTVFYGDYTHEMAYSCQSARQLFLTVGFRRVICKPVNPYSKGIIGFVRKSLWAFKVASLRFWKKVETGSSSGIFTSNIIVIGEK